MKQENAAKGVRRVVGYIPVYDKYNNNKKSPEIAAVKIVPKNKFHNFRRLSNQSKKKRNMSEELPILKGILKGVVSYHNARRLKET